MELNFSTDTKLQECIYGVIDCEEQEVILLKRILCAKIGQIFVENKIKIKIIIETIFILGKSKIRKFWKKVTKLKSENLNKN